MSTPTNEPGATPGAAAAGATPAAGTTATPTIPAAAQALAGTLTPGTPTPPAAGTPGTPAIPAPPKGKASDPAELLSDLAGERDKRQAADAAKLAAETKLAAVLQALGIGGEDASNQTPEQIAQAAQASERAARAELAVVRLAPANVNASALLDSRAFADTLAKIDPTNTTAVQAAIVEFVKDKPQYLAGRPGAGAGDAAAAGDPGSGARTMDDLLRGRR